MSSGPAAELVRPQDAFFLATETAGVQQHVAGLAIVDPTNRPGGPLSAPELAARLAARLDELPRLRQKLAWPPGGLTRPLWVDDPDFDIDRHVRRLSVPAPGGLEQLEELVAGIVSKPLDRSRPLWQLLLIDGLAGGRQGMFLHLHHAVADGRGILEVAARLFDAKPDASWPAPLPWQPRPAPPRRRLLWTAARAQAAAAWGPWAATVAAACTHPVTTGRRAKRAARGVWELARAGAAPASPLNQPITAGRRVRLLDVPASSADTIRRAFGGTVNDVVLTALAHAVHQQLHEEPGLCPERAEGETSGLCSEQAEGETSGERLRVMIPVAVRPHYAKRAPGSWTSTLSVDVPIGPMGPVARLAEIRSRTTKLKRSNQHVGAAFVMSAVGRWAPTPLHKAFARFAYRSHWFNMIVSVLRGTSAPRYLVGARVVNAFPIVPLAAGVGLTVAALSWNDHLAIGLTAAEHVPPDLGRLCDAVVACIEDLRRTAEQFPGTSAAPAAASATEPPPARRPA